MHLASGLFLCPARSSDVTMRFSFPLFLFITGILPAAAQSMDGMAMPDDHAMPGMVMPNAPASAAPMPDMAMPDMPGMKPAGRSQMPDMTNSGMAMHGMLGSYAMTREASGTSWQPQAAP